MAPFLCSACCIWNINPRSSKWSSPCNVTEGLCGAPCLSTRIIWYPHFIMLLSGKRIWDQLYDLCQGSHFTTDFVLVLHVNYGCRVTHYLPLWTEPRSPNWAGMSQGHHSTGAVHPNSHCGGSTAATMAPESHRHCILSADGHFITPQPCVRAKAMLLQLVIPKTP